MVTFTLPRFGKTRLALYVGTYQDGSGNTAVQILRARDEDLHATVSVNVPGVKLPDGQFVFKTYSENDGLFEQMLAAGLIEETGGAVDLGGWVGSQPVCRLTRQARGE